MNPPYLKVLVKMNTRNVLKKQDTSEAFGWYCITLLAELELLVAYFLNVNLTLAYEHEMSNFFREVGA